MIKIGTRGSKLAIYQAEKVKESIEKSFPGEKTEMVIIHSKGDKILDVALSKIGDKGLFTKELEDALLRREIDLAVHSLKDLPTILPEGIEIGGVLERGEVRDALVSHKGLRLEDLTPSMTIATSSLRRVAQLLMINPNFKIADIRGNVNTRLRKMEEGYCDVMLMAAAGLQRLGLDRYISQIIDPSVIMPAVSQGAIAIESRMDDSRLKSILEVINHPQTYQTTHAERIFLRTLEGGCQIPIGCYSSFANGKMTLYGFMSFIDGSDRLFHSVTGDPAEGDHLALDLADYFIQQGSRQLLERIRNHNNS